MKKSTGQRGLSLSGLLITCVVLGALALFIMRLWPLYNEYWKIWGAMESVAAKPNIGRLPAAEVHKLLLNNFEITDVRQFTRHNLREYATITKIKNSRDRTLHFKYESRGPFFHDLDLVLKFDKSILLPGGAAPE